MTARPFTRGWNAWTAKAAGPKDNQFPAGSDDAAEWERGRVAAIAAQDEAVKDAGDYGDLDDEDEPDEEAD